MFETNLTKIGHLFTILPPGIPKKKYYFFNTLCHVKIVISLNHTCHNLILKRGFTSKKLPRFSRKIESNYVLQNVIRHLVKKDSVCI